MKYFLILFFVSVLAFAADWKIIEKEGQFTAKNPSYSDLELALTSSGGIPKVKEWKSKNQQISVLYYDSGTAGTSTLIRVFRGIVVDTKNKKVLGEAPFEYQAVSGSHSLIQPKWLWKKNSLKVVDAEFSENLDIKW